MNGCNYEMVWLSHGGPGSGRYPKGSGKKNEIRKKYLDLHASRSKELENIGVYTKRHAKYAARVENKYGKSLLEKKGLNISEVAGSNAYGYRPGKYAKWLKDYDTMVSRNRKIKKSGRLTEDEAPISPGVYLDTRHIKTKMDIARGQLTVGGVNWVKIEPKDAVKIADKFLASNKKYSDVAKTYVHNKAIKKTVTRLLATFGVAAGVGVLQGLRSVKD